ncbi:class I SAM-dependent methyltransferase [Streptomyces sp. NPDC058247]|uniref:class I SAM-dependent methyltransferase n=1 Tax=Streptomyces sp. NPDC058247 TaxID=3346401 RepID=UPI0036E806A7
MSVRQVAQRCWSARGGRQPTGASPAGRFSDPVAVRLLRAEEHTPVDAVRTGVPPQGRPARTGYESVRAYAEVMVARTVAIDEALCACIPRRLVILGAGLDTRAWHLPQLARTDVREIDHPASQQDKKRARLTEAAHRTPHTASTRRGRAPRQASSRPREAGRRREHSRRQPRRHRRRRLRIRPIGQGRHPCPDRRRHRRRPLGNTGNAPRPTQTPPAAAGPQARNPHSQRRTGLHPSTARREPQLLTELLPFGGHPRPPC